jgi:tetratricopeptide (TPR) repeat protein
MVSLLLRSAPRPRSPTFVRLTLRWPAEQARAWALLSNGEFEQARQAAKESLRLNPDFDLAKSAFRTSKTIDAQIQRSNAAMDAHQYRRSAAAHPGLTLLAAEAAVILHELTASDSSPLPRASPLRLDLLAARADCLFKMGEYAAALQDAGKVLYEKVRWLAPQFLVPSRSEKELTHPAPKDDSVRAWLTRLYCLRELGRFEEAADDCKGLLERWGQNEPIVRSVAERAVFDLKKSRRPDLYKLLNVPSLASEVEIKRAYKDLALTCHPDKIPSDAPPAVKHAAEEKFKLLGMALDVLGNKEKRELWDKGYGFEGITDTLNARQRGERRHHG